MHKKASQNSTASPHRQRLLQRPRLNDLLSKAANNNLIKITAGAGYGKTQTVSMFLNHSNYRIGWLQLNKLDNFPVRFWKGFLHALSLQKHGLIAQLEQLEFPASLVAFDQFLHIFAKLVHDGARFVFVFDDFHSIHENSVINFIENLFVANIDNFCIILLSRSNIDFTNAFSSHLTESDLSFSLDEIDEYLKMQDVILTESETKEIYDYTKGWSLAIYLVGLNLQKDSQTSLDPLTDTKLIVFQLIEEEIFSIYSPLHQEFLIKLSLLEEFPAGLIHDLSNENADTMMSILKTNMFVHYSSYTQKYHLHHIFLDFLREKQIHLNQQAINEVYLITAKWYARNNLNFDAMTYYEKCNHYQELWGIILHTPPIRRPKAITSTYIRFLSGFPREFVKENPLVRVARASYMLNNLELEAASKDMMDLIEEFKTLPETAENKAVMGEAYIVLALIKQTQKDGSYVNYYKLADPCLPNGSIRDYRHTKIIGSNNAFNPNSLENKEILKLQKDLFESIPYTAKLMNGFGYGVEYLASAEVAYYKGSLQKSQEYAFEALYRAKQEEQNDIVCCTFFLLMKISAARGNYDATLNYLEQLKEYASNDTSSLSTLDIAEGWFYIRIGKEENVARWLIDDPLNYKTYPPISVGRDRLIRGYYFLEKEQYDELLVFTEQVDTLYQEKGLWLELVSIRLYQTISLYYTGDLPQCAAALHSLYSIVKENHFIMQFVEMGRHMCKIIDNIRKMNDHNIPKQWLDNIYSKSSTYAKRQAFYKAKYLAQNHSKKVRIRLTNREKEVLKDLSHGLTREEIAESLNISVNTVKSTLQNIYSKLSAVNSVDAVRIGLEMKII